MALGNLNNLIALRSKDRPTQDFIVETSGKTTIHTLRVRLDTAADAHLGNFTSVYAALATASLAETMPADVLGKLPNLQHLASVSGGGLIKGRFPIPDPDRDRRQIDRVSGRGAGSGQSHGQPASARRSLGEV
jgi:conjugal transfer pilus assembly protein TraD